MKQRLNEGIDAYLSRRRREGLKAESLRQQKMTLTRLLEQTGGNLFLDSMKSDHVDNTLEYLSRTNSQRSLANHFATLKLFFQFCVDTDRMRKSPMRGMKAPTFTVEDRNRLHVSKFGPLLDSARCGRDRFLLAAGLYLLARSNELAKIRLSDINWEEGVIRCHISKRKGKNKPTTDYKPITKELKVELIRWLREYEAVCGTLQPDWFLIPAISQFLWRPNPVGEGRIKYQTYIQTRGFEYGEEVAQEALEAVGFDTRKEDGSSANEGMHTLRRSGARARYDAKRWMGHDNALRHVQMLLNHANATMTELYIGVTLDMKQRNEELIGEWMYPQLQDASFTGEEPMNPGGYVEVVPGAREIAPEVAVKVRPELPSEPAPLGKPVGYYTVEKKVGEVETYDAPATTERIGA